MIVLSYFKSREDTVFLWHVIDKNILTSGNSRTFSRQAAQKYLTLYVFYQYKRPIKLHLPTTYFPNIERFKVIPILLWKTMRNKWLCKQSNETKHPTATVMISFFLFFFKVHMLSQQLQVSNLFL